MCKSLLLGFLVSISGSSCSGMASIPSRNPNLNQKELREEFLKTHPNITLPEGVTWDTVKIIKEEKKTLGHIFLLYRLFYLKRETFDDLFSENH